MEAKGKATAVEKELYALFPCLHSQKGNVLRSSFTMNTNQMAPAKGANVGLSKEVGIK